MAQITIDSQTVTRSEMKSPWLGGSTPSAWVSEEDAGGWWMPYDYSGLGPFVFERDNI